MRVTRSQATENRLRVIDVASRLFKEHGFNGIGLKDLMNGAGLTQGSFYKQFESKEDLAAQACERAMRLAAEQWSSIASADPERPLESLFDFYLSPEHRDLLGDGCPLVALGSDVGREGPAVRAAFETGIKAHLDILDGYMSRDNGDVLPGKAMAVLATMVGALLLSRATDDKKLSEGFLSSAAEAISKAEVA
ncbi:TetR/AcrR family transcriptional regulator [Bradyrhizobium genosp. A]|uniref:TetR/AcrR family transcriptional regulator n=1 Tax=Bradyrhizobium genosp. A TaxID=83626 RepID=UPI003CF6B014